MSNPRSQLRRACFGFLIPLSVHLSSQQSALADVKVVSQVDVTGRLSISRNEGSAPLIPYPQGEVTTYYRGDQARIELQGGVTLFDTAKDRVTILNTAQKTYIVLPLKRTLAMVNPPLDPAMAEKVPTQITVVPNVSIASMPERKTIAEKDAHKISMAATADLMQENSFSDGPSRSIGRGGRGGYGRGGVPGGGQPPGPSGASRGVLPTYEVNGEYWMSGEIDALTNGSRNRKDLLTPAFLETLAVAPCTSALVRPVAEKLAAIRGYPVMSRLTISRILTNQDTGTPPDPVVITTLVKSITEGTFDNALFKVPEGYIEIKPIK